MVIEAYQNKCQRAYDGHVNDTHPEAARVQFRLFREAGPKRRLAMATALTNQTWRMAHEALSRAHPDLSELQRQIMFVRIHYGPELAAKVEAKLQRHPRS
jgi:hypothetical protein